MEIYLSKKNEKDLFVLRIEDSLLEHFSFNNLNGLSTNETVVMLKEVSKNLDTIDTGYRVSNSWTLKKSAGFRCMILAQYAKNYPNYNWRVE